MDNNKAEEFVKAATTKEFDKLKQLLQDGVDINSQDSQGRTALMMSLVPNFRNNNVFNLMNTSADNNDEKITQFLIENGADLNIKNNRGDTALIFAIELSNKNAVELLIKKGANVNITNNKKENALFYTPNDENHATVLEMMKMLIEAKINVNQQDEQGDTILMKLIRSGKPYAQIQYFQLLLDNGADSSLKNISGHDVLDEAYANIDNLDREIIEIIEKNLSHKKPRFGINITHTARHFDLIEGTESDVLIADYIKEDPLNVVIMHGTNQYFFTTSSIIKNAYLDKKNIVFGCPVRDSYKNVDRAISYFNLRSIGLIVEHQFCNMNVFLKNEDAQLFVVYGLNKSFPGYTSYINLFNPSYDSAVSGLHCQSGQDSKVAKMVLGYPSLENNTLSTNQPANMQNEETSNENIVEEEYEDSGSETESERDELYGNNELTDLSDTESEIERDEIYGNNELNGISDTESEISETQSDIERREFFGEGKKTKKHKKTKRKKTNTKKGKRTRNNKRKI
jgi:hypothetical protein